MWRFQMLIAAIALTTIVTGAITWRNTLITAERARSATEAARDFRSTIERIGDADVGTGDADDDLRWLDDRMQRMGGQR